MEDIDYGAVFGISETGAEEQEPAEPAADTAAQGAEEQEAAEPAGDTKLKGNAGAAGAGDGADEDGAEDTGDEGELKGTEKDARFAAARRKAEAERDAAIAKAKQDADAEAKRVIDEAFQNSGLVDPYTKKPITSKEAYDAYRQRFEAEKKARVLKKSGMSDDEFNAFVQSLPEVKQAKEAQLQAEKAQQEARDAAAKVKVDEQLKEISSIDPTIRELSDIAKMPTYPRFYELVKKGNSLTDAFKLANYDALTTKTAAASKQAALNAAQGKKHMGQTQQRGVGAVSVPAEVREMYLAFNPGATDAEIQQHYAKNHKK